jgi:putative DNA primase/helicase
MMELRDQARNKWPSILAALGVSTAILTGKHVPCPICGGKDRFRFDDRGGDGGWICNVCRAGNGVDLLMKVHGWSFAETAERVREMIGEAVESAPKQPIDPKRARRLARELWQSAAPIGDDEARAYLMSRGFSGPYPAELRFCASAVVTEHPSKSRLPAMVARVVGPDGQGVNVHRTYLEGARKANMPEPRRMMPGTVPPGSSIRLWPHGGKLAVAEGIETALAVTRDYGTPCWSLINTTIMEQFAPPPEVRELIIYGDNDTKFGGQAAAYRLAYRIATRPNAPAVAVEISPQVGTDWADFYPMEHAAYG